MLVPAVYVLCSEQLLDSVQAPLLGCVQESAVSSQQVSEIPLLLLHEVQASQVVTVTAADVGSMLKGREKVQCL